MEDEFIKPINIEQIRLEAKINAFNELEREFFENDDFEGLKRLKGLKKEELKTNGK